MIHYNNNRKFFISSWISDCLLILFSVFFFYRLFLGAYPLFTPDEGRYSEVAREMAITHDYITPRLNGVVFLDKPILYYWLQTIAIRFLGITEISLRIWPILFGVMGCVMVYITGRRLFSRRAGWLAATFLALSPLYYGALHYSNLDGEVGVLIANALLCFLIGMFTSRSTSKPWFMASYVFIGLGILTKGLIGILLPAIVITLWMLINQQWSLLSRCYLGRGILIIAVITAPWYISVQIQNPQFFHFFFYTQQFGRYVSTQHYNSKVGFWFYIPVVLIGFFPWTVFLYQSMILTIRQTVQKRRYDTVLFFLLLWIISIFIFFTLPSSKTVGYIIPIFPALSLLIAHCLDQCWMDTHPIAWKPSRKLVFSCIASMLLLLPFGLNHANIANRHSTKPFALYLKHHMGPDDLIVTFYSYFQDLPVYLQRRITIVADWDAKNTPDYDNWERELWYGIPYQETQSWLIDENTLWKYWNSRQHVYVLMDDDYLYPYLARKVKNPPFLISRYNHILLITNHPIVE